MSDYKVVEVNLSTLQFKVMIFVIPPKDIEDKLTYFTREKGLIPKSLYEDFIIASCVANVNQLLQYSQQQGIDMEKLREVRQEIIQKSLENNPKLDPTNIVINTNHVLKTKSGSLKEGEISLTENSYWKHDFYAKDKAQNPTENQKLDMSKIQNVKELPCIKVQKFWRRLGRYITIKQFEPGSELIILADRSFSTRTSFEQYVVTICVEEVEDLFMQLDRSQLPQRVSSHILIHELYELCRKSNPFLDYDVYKENAPESVAGTEDEAVDPFEGVQQQTAQRMEDTLTETLQPRKFKSFREVSKEKLLGLNDAMKKKVIGQSQSVDDLIDAIQRSSVGLKDPEQPIGSFIFTGATGIGKTYTAKILAEELVGTRHGLIAVDCSEYSADHEYAKLIGAPSGYIGHEHGGYLTNAIKKNPFSVVLFDEIEKASPKVHQLLLQIMDEGRLTDGKGQKVSFRDAIIVMTSNLGVKETQQVEKTIGFGNACSLTDEKRIKAVKDALKKEFKPEFLNRISCIVNFCSLTKEDYLKIIELELEKLKTYLKLNKTEYSKLKLKFDASLFEYVYKLGIDEKFGARPLQRAIEQKISTPLARKLLKESIQSEGSTVLISVKKDEVLFTVKKSHKKKKPEEKTENPPFYMENGGAEAF